MDDDSKDKGVRKVCLKEWASKSIFFFTISGRTENVNSYIPSSFSLSLSLCLLSLSPRSSLFLSLAHAYTKETNLKLIFVKCKETVARRCKASLYRMYMQMVLKIHENLESMQINPPCLQKRKLHLKKFSTCT